MKIYHKEALWIPIKFKIEYAFFVCYAKFAKDKLLPTDV